MSSQLVMAYKNLDKPCFIVRDAETNKTIMLARHVVLADVEFVVSLAGWERALRENKKNVHALCVGRLVSLSRTAPPRGALPGDGVSYNPFKAPHFYFVRDKAPIYRAERVEMAHGLVFVDRPSLNLSSTA